MMYHKVEMLNWIFNLLFRVGGKLHRALAKTLTSQIVDYQDIQKSHFNTVVFQDET